MALPVTTRAAQGFALSHNQMDANFTDLNDAVDANAADITTAEADIVTAQADISALEATRYNYGWEDYNDSGAAYPKALTSAGTKYLLENDGAGPYSDSTFVIPGRGPIWDSAADDFNWGSAGADLVLGDTVDLRLDIDFISSGANHQFDVYLRMGLGTASEFDLHVAGFEFKASGTHNRSMSTVVYMGSNDILNHPAELYVSSDSTGDSVVYNGHFARYNLRSPSTT